MTSQRWVRLRYGVGMSDLTDAWGVTAQEAHDLITARICPICGEGPFKVPLNHSSRKHGVDNFTMREACGLTLTESVTAPESAAKWSKTSRERDVSAILVTGSGSRGKYRTTTAGRAAVTRNLEPVNADPVYLEQKREAARLSSTPEAIRKWRASMAQRNT